MQFDHALAGVIVAEMEAQRLSAPALAMRAQMPARTVQSYLYEGRRMRVWQARALARALGLTLAELITRAESLTD